MKRYLALFVLVECALLSSPVWACKALVRFPEHLNVSASEKLEWHVIAIESGDGESYEGRIQRSFGEASRVNEPVTVSFIRGEEPHAVCPIKITAGSTYLLHTVGSGGKLSISRYNWLNVPSTHERFPVYVQDLATAR